MIVVPGIIAFNLFSKDMQLEAAKDNAPIFAKYVKANPQTSFVTVVESPSEEKIKGWKPGKYMIAVFPDTKAIDEAKIANPYVFPITKKEFEAAEPAKFTVFASEDKAWENTNPPFAAEVKAYNEKTKKAAEAAGASVTTEKPIVYKYDTALGQLLGSVLPQGKGLVGFVLAALLGAVVSSLAAMLNAASTIFSMDIFKRYISPNASQGALVFLGRTCVVLFSIVAMLLAPQLGNPKIKNSIFTIIQESQGFISPGILAVFVFGLLIRRGPRMSGVVGLITNIAAYGIIMQTVPELNFLNRMAVCFGLCLAVMSLMTVPASSFFGLGGGLVAFGALRLAVPGVALWPAAAIAFGVCVLVMLTVAAIKQTGEAVIFVQKTELNLETSKGALAFGVFVVLLTITLYVLFSPLVFAK